MAHYNATTKRVYDMMEAFPKPTIAQIDGFCIGGGVALALCCDLRICGEGSNFAVPAAKLGLGYGFPGIKRLVDVVGPSFAKEIFFTARRFTAEEARIMGLVNRVVPDAEVAQAAEETAAMIAANAPMTVASVKYIVGQTVTPESAPRLGRMRRPREGLLRQPGLHRGSPRLHGKAQAELRRRVTACPDASTPTPPRPG